MESAQIFIFFDDAAVFTSMRPNKAATNTFHQKKIRNKMYLSGTDGKTQMHV